MEDTHHMFMKLETGQVFCLPYNYEVIDRSLDDIRHVLNPKFSKEEILNLDKQIKWSRALDGTEYMPGLVGLNNMKNNDYANVIIQILSRVTPIRDFFLIPKNYDYCKSEIVHCFGELLRKMWNTRNFKGQVSPHELMQAVMKASAKKFNIENQSDPVDFMIWFLNTLHQGLVENKQKKSSIIMECFQGKLEICQIDSNPKINGDKNDIVPFLILGLDLPPPPLFRDPLEKNIIPQIPIYTILRKYDNMTISDDIKKGRRRFKVLKLPKYLILHMKRFTKNNFFIEKNPTIVNFPVKNLDLSGICQVRQVGSAKDKILYNLIANVCHNGKSGEGTYHVHVERKNEDSWYEVQDLRLTEVLPQIVSLSETYMQVYETITSNV